VVKELRVLKIFIAIGIIFAVAIVTIFVMVFGLPPIVDPDAWTLRLELKELSNVQDVSIANHAEWAGKDDYGAKIHLSAGRYLEIRRVTQEALGAHPTTIILSALGTNDIFCFHTGADGGSIALFGIDVLARNSDSLSHLEIKTLEDVILRYNELDRIFGSWLDQKSTVQIRGVLQRCWVKRRPPKRG
jgi:hypothetical protein